MRIPPVDVDDVKADFIAAARLDPKNREVRAELEKLKVRQQENKRKDKSLYGGMFA